MANIVGAPLGIVDGSFYTPEPGSQRVVAVSIGAEEFLSVTFSPTLGGIPFVEGVFIEGVLSDRSYSYIGYILESDIPSGSNEFLLNSAPNSVDDMQGVLYTIEGVDQLATGSGFSLDAESNQAPVLNITGATGGVALGIIAANITISSMVAAPGWSTDIINVGNGQRVYGANKQAVSGVDVFDPDLGVVNDSTLASFVFSPISPSGPALTGPDSTTDGTPTTATGTLLDTVTTLSLISGTYAVEQTIDGQTTTTLDYVANSGVNDCVPGTPSPGVPLEATITAPGITPYVVQQKVDDGVNPAATRPVTLNAPATHDVVQTMVASANTIDDQSIFGTSWIDVEDDMQAYVPKQVDGVNFTWNFDGTFTTDQDKTVNVRVPYFAPSTGQYGCINFTIQGSSIKPTGVNKNKRQSLTYQFYYNKNWRDKFQGGVN